MPDVSFRQVLDFAIGGGWGVEAPLEGSVPVRVIRGTDFARIQAGDYESVPERYEKETKVGRRALKGGDILLEISGGSRTSNQSTGRSFFISQEMLERLGRQAIPASFCRLLRVDESRVDPRYAYYCLQDMYHSGRVGLYEQQSTGISNFQFEYFLDAEIISLPPLDEQRRIAHILGGLDDKIELNRRMSQTLEAMAQALFKSWFVDFDPVRAKAQGQPTGLPPELDALFPDTFQESGLGKIPSGWEVGSLGDVIELAYGKALRAKDRRHGSVPVYGSSGQVGWHDRKLIAGPGIVVGRKGNPGVVKWSAADFFPIDTTFYVVPHGHITSLLFLFFALQWQGLPSIAADSAVPGLNRNLAYMNRQLVPPSQLVSQFDERVRALFGRCRSLNDESAQLACQRDALLPELMCGKVTAAPTNAGTQT